MEMSKLYNGSQWVHDMFLVNKARATEYITGRSSTLLSLYIGLVCEDDEVSMTKQLETNCS